MNAGPQRIAASKVNCCCRFGHDLESGAEHQTELKFQELDLEEMLAAVERGDVDLAAAALTVNYDREKRMDFTHPFHSSGLGIAVSGREVRGWDGVMSAIFSLTFLKVMVGLSTVLLASGVAVYFFERKRNPSFGGGIVKGISSGIWWAAVTMTTVGYGDKVPKSAGGRLIACFWMFSGLFIIASFTAAVTSALTVTQLKSRIAGPGDSPLRERINHVLLRKIGSPEWRVVLADYLGESSNRE